MAQFIISHTEAIEMIRRQFMLPTTVEVIIQQTTEPTVEDGGWIDVPDDHRDRKAPEDAQQYDCIEVMYGDGTLGGTGAPDDWNLSWAHDGDSQSTIVKFRPIK